MTEISLSKDKLEAYITVKAGKEAFPSEQDILNELEKQNVRFGIDHEMIKKIVREKKDVYKKPIARGRPAQKGNPAVIDWKITANFAPAPSLITSQRVDFKKALPFEPVVEKQVLAEKKAPGKGVDGISVTNEPLSSLGNDIQLPAGRNTHISEDGLLLIADMNGSAFFENNQVHVDRIYHIKGSVSYATGNVKFDGPVVIEGDVRSGFRVDARDSIYIGGNVEAANIYSQHGDITIVQGILGQKRAKILAGGSLFCGFVQDAVVGVRKNIIIQHYAMNSSLTAGGKIELLQNEGLVRGGTLTSEQGIFVKNVGSDRNYYTELKIQNQGENASQHALWEISKERSEMSLRISSLKKRHSFLAILKGRMDGLSQEKKVEFDFLEKEIERLNKKIEELSARELLLQKEASKERINREIQVEENLYPNVSVDLNGLGFHTDQTLRGVKIFRFKDEIVVESLLGMEDTAYDIFVPNNK